MYVHMYVCMYVCAYVCMYVRMYVRMYDDISLVLIGLIRFFPTHPFTLYT